MVEMDQIFPGISANNPVLKVTLKPIDDILAKQRMSGGESGPANVDEIFALLRNLK
jgi:hypothetical protein